MRIRARDEDFIRTSTAPQLVLAQSLQKLNLSGVVQVMRRNTRNETEIAVCATGRRSVQFFRRQLSNYRPHRPVHLFQQMDIGLPVRFTDFFRPTEPVGTSQRKRTTSFSGEAPANDIFPVSRVDHNLPDIVALAARAPRGLFGV